MAGGRLQVAMLILLMSCSVVGKKVHLDLKDLADLKISDIMELVLPAINSVK